MRVSVLWEWLHKGACFTADDPAGGVRAGDALTPALFDRIMEEEYGKLLRAGNRDVHDDSKRTTLPIARQIVERCVRNAVKAPWCIDLLNLNLNNHDLGRARERIEAYFAALERDGTRLTANPDLA
jgi:malate synthase